MNSTDVIPGDLASALVEVGMSFAQKYTPVLDFSGWRVAMLRPPENFSPQSFQRVERHRSTNEVFILTAGRADLIIVDPAEGVKKDWVFPMTLNVAYNIQQSVWHEVIMSPDAHIILFERTDTSAENSDYWVLDTERVAAIKRQFTIS